MGLLQNESFAAVLFLVVLVVYGGFRGEFHVAQGVFFAFCAWQS